jgi:hypothetical protein
MGAWRPDSNDHATGLLALSCMHKILCHGGSKRETKCTFNRLGDNVGIFCNDPEFVIDGLALAVSVRSAPQENAIPPKLPRRFILG